MGCGGSGAEDQRVWSFGLIYGFDFDFNFINLWVSVFGWPSICGWCFWGFKKTNSLGMFFVVVVAAVGCRGYLGIGFLFLFGF